MKVALLVFAAIIASAVGNAVGKPDYGTPCKPTDLTCCKSKFEIFFELIIQEIGKTLVVEKLEVTKKLGCCELNIVLTQLGIEIDGFKIESFDLDLNTKKIKIVLKDSEVIVFTDFEVLGKCIDLPLYVKDKAKIKLKDVEVKIDLELNIDSGCIRLADVIVGATTKSISFELKNPFNKKLEKLLNDIPKNKLLVIATELIEQLLCFVDNLLFTKLSDLINGLKFDLLFLLE